MAKSSLQAQQQFLDYLKCNPASAGISSKIFEEISGLKRTMFYNVIKDLEELGYVFTQTKAGKTAYYTISNLDNLAQYKVATTDDYYKYLIIETLNRHRTGMLLVNPRKRAEKRGLTTSKTDSTNSYSYLLDELYDISEDIDDYEGCPINVGESKIRELLAEMVNDGEITTVNAGALGTVYLPNNNESVFSTNDLENALQILEQLPTKHKNYPLLQSAKEKIAFELFHNNNSMYDNPNYLVYGKKWRTFSSLTEDLSILSEADYKNHIVKVTFDDEGLIKAFFFAVGKVVYSELSGQAYIIGKEMSSKNSAGKYAFLPLSKLQRAASTDITNLEYDAPIYYDFIQRMLDISTCGAEKFEVEIHTEYLSTGAKIKRLHQNRGAISSIVDKHKDSKEIAIIYSDMISDWEKIEPYFMGYGRACTVKQPKALKNDIKKDLEQALENYRQEGFDV